MKTFVQAGDVIAVTVAAGSDAVDLSSGDGYLVGSLFGVVVSDVVIGVIAQLQVTGVVDIAKTSAEAWTVGQKIYWVVATSLASSTAGGNKQIGVATAVAANPSSTGRVRLSAAFTI